MTLISILANQNKLFINLNILIMRKITLLFALVMMFTLTVSAQLNEDFESTTFPPTGWTVLSPDLGTGWERQTAGVTPIPGWNGGTITTAPTVGGGMGVAFATYTTGGAASNDQWLITPSVTPVAGDKLGFWMEKFGQYKEEVQVKVSTTDAQAASFTVDLQIINLPADSSGWKFYSYDLSAYTGQAIYIAFREVMADNQADGAAIMLDVVQVSSNVGINEATNNVTLNTYPNPANDVVYVSSSVEIKTLSLTNIVGQTVLSTEVNNSNTSVDVSTLSSGVYMLRVETTEGFRTEKLVVE